MGYTCFFICFMEKSNITINNTIDVEGLTDHKNDSDESDKTVNDDILLPLLKECKNKEVSNKKPTSNDHKNHHGVSPQAIYTDRVATIISDDSANIFG
ncbi:unnamed protein product, partial [Timema podura]|nr:unnamed protein product [Timema podura]